MNDQHSLKEKESSHFFSVHFQTAATRQQRNQPVSRRFGRQEPRTGIQPVVTPDFTEAQSLNSQSDWKYYTILLLKVLIWIALWKYFVSLGFGAVYFIVTSSILMYVNTGTRARGTLSAYSVFNRNHERIDGTFTAEQFERELRHGSGSVK